MEVRPVYRMWETLIIEIFQKLSRKQLGLTEWNQAVGTTHHASIGDEEFQVI